MENSGHWYFFFISWVLSLASIALCLGIHRMGKSRRGGDWYTMFLGILFLTIATFCLLVMAAGFRNKNYSDGWELLIQLAGFGILVGPFLFSVGFAIHGVKTSRLRNRITELEMMNLAQATELARLRDR